mmetsp:Transcript_32291/g.73774  ORF Transcript_32291/g.73774 Transcript_32291/m.73774 type:complete len:704 (+) Transcript_32291:182-2293(+)
MPSLAALTRLAAPALASLLLVGGADGSDAGTVTLPIAAFRLDLTIQRPPVRARLLRGTSETAGGEWTDAGSHGNDRDLIGSRILERAVDGAIQGAAESHLLSSYAGAFPPGPRQVLLTVVSDQDDGPGSAGIYVRSSYVGGVATSPAGPGAPTRDELEAATADAFAIPGEGEAFLRALQGSDVPALDGLLLIGAAGVDGGYTRPVLPEPADSEKGSGGGSILHDGSGGTSVWAVAAVSALGAMFLVISCCTGILYCDWKKRRNRRDARRKERAEARGVHVPGSGGGKRAKGPKSSRSGSRVYSNFDSYDDGGVEMHIVVPPAASGETEPAGSPSTRGSRDDSVPPPPPPPPPMDQQDEDSENDEEQEEEEENDEPDEDNEQEEQPDVPDVPQEFMFDVDSTPMDPDLIEFSSRERSGKGGGRGLIFSQDRGRYIKPMLPKGKVIRLAVDATLRASAPYQRGRRERAKGTKDEGRGVFIEQSDVRTKKMARKAGSLIIFVVDASGSMALNRMNAAKGAAMSLLTEAYQSRDQICLIPFQGDRADVLLPPTRSIAQAKKRLEVMPCGGGSPLADALQAAMLTGLNAQKTGDVGKVVVVCISDGRANVPLCVSKGEEFDPDADEDSKDGKPSRQYLKDEVLACAKQLGVLPGFNLLCIDTENKFISTGVAKDIADAAMGKYHQIAKADGSAIASVTNQALNAIKNE